MDAKILIPVRAHILKYLKLQFGQQLVVSSRGYASCLIYALLEKHAKKDPGKIRPSQKMIDNRNYFGYPVYVGSSIFSKRGSFISPENIKHFNDCMDDLIREEMYRFCRELNVTRQLTSSEEMEIDFNIRRFQDFYGFNEDDLPFDNLKRWYYRERARLADRINYTPPFEPQFTLTL